MGDKNMSISCVKSSKDNRNFKLFKAFGFEVHELDDLERADETIERLIKDQYNTIVVSNEVANFSQDIITKYNKKDNINIIISAR